MSLRRTALERKSELRRTPLQRKKPMNRARAVRTQVAKARRDTGPTVEQRAIVVLRANGCCERCGRLLHSQRDGWIRGHAIHHRQPRKAGGTSSKAVNSPANLLLLCDAWASSCHPWVESNRTKAYAAGLLVHSWEDPATVPVERLDGDGWFLLTDDGDRVEVAA